MANDNQAQIVGPARQLVFLLGGKAEFTIRNPETGGRFTFKVTRPKNRQTMFVRVLTGPDNHSDYELLGLIDAHLEYRRAERSRISSRATSARAFRWMWKRLRSYRDLEPAQLWHIGHCGMCGRKLTVPESIASGIGPRCTARLAA